MRTGDRTSSQRSYVVSRGIWRCDGCGNIRPHGSGKHIITEGRKVVACLCVACWARPAISNSGFVANADADGVRVAEAWEEVFGARGLNACDVAELEKGQAFLQDLHRKRGT